MSGAVRFDVDAATALATLTIDRPDAQNMLTPALVHDITAHLDRVDHDDDIKALLLRSDGPDFCAGWDPDEAWSMYVDAPGGAVKKHPSQRARLIAQADLWWGPTGLYARLLHCRKVTIAEVRGAALDSGLLMTLCCDLAVASETARFGAPRWHALGADGDMSLLVASVGLRRAKELMFTRARWAAERALSYGLVDWVVADGDLAEKAREVGGMAASIMRDGIVTEKYAVFASLERMGVGHSFAAATVVAASLSNIHFQPGEFNFLATLRNDGRAAALQRSRSATSTLGD